MYVEITNKMATTEVNNLANGIDKMKVDDSNQNRTAFIDQKTAKIRFS